MVVSLSSRDFFPPPRFRPLLLKCCLSALQLLVSHQKSNSQSMLHIFAVCKNFRVLRKACAIWLCARNITVLHFCQVDVPENLLSSAGEGGGMTFHDGCVDIVATMSTW